MTFALKVGIIFLTCFNPPPIKTSRLKSNQDTPFLIALSFYDMIVSCI
jgi:hypothetical protein